ncbi:MAG: hypothetical protein JW384_00855 [Nitrosomonadaceae bacterium]|nr:hypothetical protein [Nitrosomonadaceae bacterium]
MGKTKFLAKGPISARHLYERAQHFLRTIPAIQHLAREFTPEMFTVEGIEVLGTPIGTDVYIRNFVAQNCLKIVRDIEKLEPLTDGFTHFQLILKTMNTRTQYTSANITLPPQEHFVSAQNRHVDTAIQNAILKKGTRNSYGQWPKQDYDMAVTMLQMPHALGGFGLTPNVLAQSTAKVAMSSRFLGFVGSLPLEEQKIWLPNQSAQDPQTWLAPNLLHLKEVYEVLLNKHNCKEQESYVVQDQPLPTSDTLLLPPLSSLYKVHMRNQEMPQTGDSRPVMPPSQHALSKQVMKNWDFWEKKNANATNKRMLEQWALHKPQKIRATSTHDLDPPPLAANDHPSVLPHEMFALEPGDPPSRTLTWKPLGFLSHVKRRTSDDRLPLSLWEVWLCTQLGVPIPDLIGHLRQCPCNAFQIDCFGDHLQTCQVKSAATQVHDWAVYKLSGILGSVGHRVKIHKITPAQGKERGDLEIRDYVVMQKPQDGTDRLPPPRTLIMDFTLTHTRFGRSQLHSLGQLTHSRRCDGAPEPDGALRESARTKIRHYRQLYVNRPDPIAFMPVAVDTSGRIYDDFSRLLFLHAHREASALANELQEESEQFRFLRAACYANIKGSVGLILAKSSAMRISIPLDLSSRPFIPLPRFMRSRRAASLLAPSLVFTPRRFA